MPLRDHFRSPVNDRHSWEELHGGWPMVIVQQLRKLLPAGYVAGPKVHLGSQAEIDIGTFEEDGINTFSSTNADDANEGTVATAVWAPTSMLVETELPDFDQYEVRIYDTKRGRQLVAAIEIVSPSNKDRPEHRNAFIAKCVGLLREGVAVSIVDLVTVRHFNLYADVLAFIGHRDGTLGDVPAEIYVSSCRYVKHAGKMMFETWSNPLNLGQPLPTIPLWLSPKLAIALNLETSYEQACHDLWIS